MTEQVGDFFNLIEKIETLIDRMDILIPKMDAILNRVVIPSRSIPKPDLSLLSEKQRAVFAEIAAIEGSDAAARRKAQKALNKLKGEKVTEALGRHIAQTLRDRGWGLQCSCGEIGQFLWQKNRHCAEGGLLVLSHKTQGKQQTHDSSTVFSEYVLMEKPDRRTIKKKNDKK